MSGYNTNERSDRYESGGIGNDNLGSSGRSQDLNPSNDPFGTDQFTSGSRLDSSNYDNSGRDTLGSSDNYGSGRDNTRGGSDSYVSSNKDRDIFGSSGRDRDTVASSGLGSGVGGTDRSGFDNTLSEGGLASLNRDDTFGSSTNRDDTFGSTNTGASGRDNYGSSTRDDNIGSSGRDNTYGSANRDGTFGSITGTSGYDNVHGSSGVGSSSYEHAPGVHGSGTHAGAGYGNKVSDSGDVGEHNTRFGSGTDTAPYSGATEYGSGSTGGAGSGNKLNASTSHGNKSEGKSDSTMGKLMEKAGNLLHKENIAEKGRAKREDAGASTQEHKSTY